jgi:hypothetical protein
MSPGGQFVVSPDSVVGGGLLGFTIVYMARISNGQPLEAIPLADWLVRLSGRRLMGAADGAATSRPAIDVRVIETPA